MREKWMVVQLHRYKKFNLVSKHWWKWTARISCRFSEIEQPNGVFDVWRTPS